MVTIEPLAAHPTAIELLREWFVAEWPAYYGAGGPGDAESDLRMLATPAGGDRLPFGLVALRGDVVCGVVALKAESIASHRHLAPWVGAGLVEPSSRGQGVGALLLAAVEQEAARRGFEAIYCATATAHSLLLRGGWVELDRVFHDGEDLVVYRHALSPPHRAAPAARARSAAPRR